MSGDGVCGLIGLSWLATEVIFVAGPVSKASLWVFGCSALPIFP